MCSLTLLCACSTRGIPTCDRFTVTLLNISVSIYRNSVTEGSLNILIDYIQKIALNEYITWIIMLQCVSTRNTGKYKADMLNVRCPEGAESAINNTFTNKGTWITHESEWNVYCCSSSSSSSSVNTVYA